ncbi:hypothetical protein HHK36_030157 [Tetracentron sinense]|uniref:Uncharacterized protein n=1 Tax=Tetracentron sinense TaxID=13715 RepID=A0A835D393_TETSI|nr:hypothetical protein HHK36_030157 [Tetracentron sinense]
MRGLGISGMGSRSHTMSLSCQLLALVSGTEGATVTCLDRKLSVVLTGFQTETSRSTIVTGCWVFHARMVYFFAAIRLMGRSVAKKPIIMCSHSAIHSTSISGSNIIRQEAAPRASAVDDCSFLSKPKSENTVAYRRIFNIVSRTSGRLGGLNSENFGAIDSKNLRVKLVLLGDSGVGKSCIVLRFVRGQFDPTSKVTVGASFLSQTIALQDSTTVKFEIWDTAGQERYAALAPLYYRGAAVAVVVYDITSSESFSKAQYWVKELQKHGSPDIVLALVGNKADLEEKREVPIQDGMDYAEKNGMFFIETSAKTADNINQLFEVKL